MIEKGSYVSIRRTILTPGERTAKIPEETKAVPFEIFIKGRLVEDAPLGGEAMVVTRTGRTETGLLEEVNPVYELNYGDFVEELLKIGEDARSVLFKGDV